LDSALNTATQSYQKDLVHEEEKDCIELQEEVDNIGSQVLELDQVEVLAADTS